MAASNRRNKQVPTTSSKDTRREERSHAPGTAAAKLIEELTKHGRWKSIDRMASFSGGTIHLPGALLLALEILTDPEHPDNDTPFMVEFVRMGQTTFLHLVEKPPREVLALMSQGQSVRYESSNSIAMLSNSLGAAKSEPDDANPYDPSRSKQYHKAFALASSWVALSELLTQIRDQLCGGSEVNARSLWHQIASPHRNANRSCKQERNENGVLMVRAVRIQ